MSAHLQVPMRGRHVARPTQYAGPGRHRTTKTHPAPAGGQQKEQALMSIPDALTVRPSLAELRIAYLRKVIVAIIPVFTAGFLVLAAAVNSGRALDGVTWWSVLAAVVQAAATFFPSNAVAKAALSLLTAIGAAVVAALTHGGVSGAEGVLIVAQVLVWATAAIVPNSARPDVVQGEVVGRGVHDAGLPQ